MLAFHVLSDELWEQVKNGELWDLLIGGSATYAGIRFQPEHGWYRVEKPVADYLRTVREELDTLLPPYMRPAPLGGLKLRPQF